jgi:hypothetical protein
MRVRGLLEDGSFTVSAEDEAFAWRKSASATECAAL